MNKKKIEEIIALMEKHNLSEIEVEEEGVRLHLKKAHGSYEVIMPAEAPRHISLPKGESPEAKPAGKNFIEIKSPMVGTFYRAPSPDASPFVEIGSALKEGDVLCIIEAMKLMNEIKAEVKGKIADVLVENGDPIEFGQVLFLVEPA